MKVLFVSDADAYYGAPKAMLELIITLRKKYDIIPIVFTSEKSVINDFCNDNGIENYVTFHRGFLFDKGNFTLRYITKNFLRFVRYKVQYYLSLFMAEKYVNFEGIDIIHSNSDRNDLGMELAKKHGIKHIMHMREGVRCNSFRKDYINYINSNTDYCIAISKCVEKEWLAEGIEKNRIKVVYDGIDLDDILIKDEFESSTFRIVCVGSLYIPHKHQEKIIQALEYVAPSIIDNISVDFIGDGKDEKRLKLFARDSKCKNIHFLGYRNDVRSLLRKYDCGIMSSSDEAFGRTTIEYGAAGLAVLASNCGANLELIEDHVNGLIYDFNSPRDLAEKLSILYNDKKLRRKLGVNSIESARNKYSKELNAENVFKLYNK